MPDGEAGEASVPKCLQAIAVDLIENPASFGVTFFLHYVMAPIASRLIRLHAELACLQQERELLLLSLISPPPASKLGAEHDPDFVPDWPLLF